MSLKRNPLLALVFNFIAVVCAVTLGGPLWAESAAPTEQAQAELEKDVTQGALRVVQADGTVVECPLKHTDVEAEISGFIARVRVKQTFSNPLKEKIEAVYVFPLPHESAVDAMTMTVGEKKIVGVIKRRAEARQIYEQALFAGQTAALLEQERPNIFTQSVGNIAPGQDVVIDISYVDVLEYDQGGYEFRFPMVVGPRYNPGSITSSPAQLPAELQGKTSPATPNTSQVPDASRINPPVLRPGNRTGHDISLTVLLDAGVPVQDLAVANHKTDVNRSDDRQAKVVLSPDDTLPNKDFVLRYKVAGKKPELAMLAHTDPTAADAVRSGSGYFMLMIQPREDERLTKSPPREMVFLVDVSGSMSGQPTAKVIEAMQNMLKFCREIDTVQVITFAADSQKLFERPVPVNAANISRALHFTQGLQGAGGTEMLKGVKMAIDEPLDKERMRIVVMLTDGYIGNEAAIIEHVGKECGDRIRFWCLGIGSSPNMFLVDGVARQGGGMGRTLGLNDDSAGLTREIMTRIQRAQLAKLRIEYGGLQVSQTYPARLPELWSGQPVVVYGRYAGSGDAVLTVRGEVEGEAAAWQLAVTAPHEQPNHAALARIWARQKVEDLMQQTFYQGSPAVEEEVTGLALQYGLMSPYTSFVAVDSDVPPRAEPARAPRRMLVPVPLPEGTRWEGFFGDEGELRDAGRPNVALGLDGAQLREAAPQVTALTAAIRTKSESKSAADARYFRRNGAPTAGAGASAMLGRGYLAPVAAGGFGGLAGKPAQLALPASAPASAAAKQLGERTKLPSTLDGKYAAGRQDFFHRSLATADQMAAFPAAAEEIQKALEAGRKQYKEGHLAEARLQLARALLLAAAAGADTAEAASELESVHRDEVQQAVKAMPALGTRLDLVLRDQPVAAALEAIAKAAHVKVQLMPGSVDDARQMTGERDLRIAFLDLRRATTAEALDWLLLPERMEWWLDGDTIVAGTARRRAGNSAWIYDVAAMVLPADTELAGDDAAKVAACRKAADDFIETVRKHLSQDATALAWFTPGEVLLTGDAALHERAGRLFAALADPRAQLPAELADLHKTTAKRSAARRDKDAEVAAARRRDTIALKHAEFGWRLLSAAVAGKLDLEAISELEFAWKQPETKELLRGPTKAVVFRSLWTLVEAGRALPDEPELRQLVAHARSLCQPRLGEAVEALKKSPDDAGASAVVLYAALAERERGSAATLLDLLSSQTADLQLARKLAQAMLDPASVDKNWLAAVVRGDLAGEDLVTLAALACRRAGGDTWQIFRGEAQRLLGSQPLPGDVVVLVSRLDAAGKAKVEE